MSTRIRAGLTAVTILLALSVYISLSGSKIKPIPSTGRLNSAQNANFPQKIWQTWDTSAQALEDELQRFSKSWIDLNPSYRYELLTDESALTYVRERFSSRKDIVRTFENTKDVILRADLLRYLAVLSDGGVYTDIDTHCTRPIDEWVPAEYASFASLVVGVEYDAQGGPVRGDFTLPAQVCQWTFMAKPGNRALQHVVDRVVAKLEDLGRDAISSPVLTQQEVKDTTGPHIFTNAILESLSSQTGHSVSYADISNLTQPKLIGDVLVLPVSAFGSGQSHSGSKEWGNDEQLMSHHWFGFRGWVKTHVAENIAQEPRGP